MVDQQIRTLSPDEAIDAELTRIIQIAENADTYRHQTLRTYAYKLLRETFPERINRERWRELAGRDPDGRLADEPGAPTLADDRRLLREHGRALCCEACDRDAAARLRAELAQAGQDQEPEEDHDVCDHGESEEEDWAQCRRCRGRRDCDHYDTSCPDCGRCEATHECRDCGADPECAHQWECSECGERV